MVEAGRCLSWQCFSKYRFSAVLQLNLCGYAISGPKVRGVKNLDVPATNVRLARGLGGSHPRTVRVKLLHAPSRTSPICRGQSSPPVSFGSLSSFVTNCREKGRKEQLSGS